MWSVKLWCVRGLVAAALLVSGLVMLPSAASAGSGGAATPFVPTPVTVGETGIAASITLENRNNGAEAALTNTVCNAGEDSPPCSDPEVGIVFVPSCSRIAAGQCTVAGRDPGVIVVSSNGLGRAGSACAGLAFATSVIDAATGATLFDPSPPGSHVTLPGFGASCIIDFTVDVLRMPGADFRAATPGVQTAQLASFTSYTGASDPGALSNFASGSTSGVTVNRATPSIATAASADVELGAGSIDDRATVTGRVSPTGSPTVTFRLFGPDDSTCVGGAVFTSSVSYPSIGGQVTSAPFTPTLPGTYRWIADYSGDTNNAPVSGTCGDVLETVSVTPPTTTTTTTVPPTTTTTTTIPPTTTTTTVPPTTTTIPPTTTTTVPPPTTFPATTTTTTVPPTTTTVPPSTTTPEFVTETTEPPTTEPATTSTEPETTTTEPDTTPQPTTTLGTIPHPNFETTITLPVLGEGSGAATGWGLGLVLVGGMLIVIASTRRRAPTA
jgi:hypothetical protein